MWCKRCYMPIQWNPVYSEWMVPDMSTISGAVWCRMDINGVHLPGPRDEVFQPVTMADYGLNEDDDPSLIM